MLNDQMVKLLMYILWKINIDPGSHPGWKIFVSTRNGLFPGFMLIYQRVIIHYFWVYTNPNYFRNIFSAIKISELQWF